MKFQISKNTLKELWGEHTGSTGLSMGDVMKKAKPHLRLIEKLADSIYPEKTAEGITLLTRAVSRTINEADELMTHHFRSKPLDDYVYEEYEEEIGEEPEYGDSDRDDWEFRRDRLELKLRRQEDEMRSKLLDKFNKKCDEFEKQFVDLIAELEKWEVAKYPDASKADLIRADMDSLTQRLARGEISEKTYNDAIKRLEDQLKKIKQMGA